MISKKQIDEIFKSSEEHLKETESILNYFKGSYPKFSKKLNAPFINF